jgi:hypothetical protein
VLLSPGEEASADFTQVTLLAFNPLPGFFGLNGERHGAN